MSSVTWCLVGTGTGEDWLQLWRPSLRRTWARLHASVSISAEDRSYTLAPSSSAFSSASWTIDAFVLWISRLLFAFMQQSWPRRVHFLPPIIWIQAGLLYLLLKDGDLVNDSNLFFHFKITCDWLKRVQRFFCCVSLNKNMKRTLTQIRPTAFMWHLLKAIQEQVWRGWFISVLRNNQRLTRIYSTLHNLPKECNTLKLALLSNN